MIVSSPVFSWSHAFIIRTFVNPIFLDFSFALREKKETTARRETWALQEPLDLREPGASKERMEPRAAWSDKASLSAARASGIKTVEIP